MANCLKAGGYWSTKIAARVFWCVPQKDPGVATGTTAALGNITVHELFQHGVILIMPIAKNSNIIVV